MNQNQIDGVTKARILSNIERAGRDTLFQSNEEYMAYVAEQAGIEEFPEAAAESYAMQHADKDIATLMEELNTKLSETNSGEVAVPPTESAYVPKVVSRFQARAALALAGMLDAVEAAVSQGDIITKLAWQDAQEFRRDSATVLALASMLGLTEEQLDNLFIQAAQITA